ncbi:tyrosine-type recombinase/integrase [Microbacterium sp. E-13]|uniref:tyrosine-type recombinase/integrase n=1 Tax=Microbacterium sp. E-13 TaxID=3404048 RepID=UPI003CEAE531
MTKRFNGEGTFRQRADGRWEGRLAYTDADEIRRRMSFYAPTEKAVRAKVRDATRRIERGEPAKDSAQTVGAWCDEWCATTLEVSMRKPTTKSLMRTVVAKHVKPSKLAAVQLAKLRPTHLDAWVLELRRKERELKDGSRTRALSESSVARVFRVLSVILDGAVRDEHLASNPARKVERPTAERQDARVLTMDEVAAVLAAARQMDEDPRGHRSHNYPLFALIAATGLRKGEALALRWQDVDFATGAISVRGTLSRVSGELVVTSPKTKKSRRTLTPAEGVMRVLREYRTRQLEDRLFAGNQWKDTGHVFTTGLGAPRDPRGVLRSMEAAARRAGLEKVAVHTLRHSAATVMLEQGTHIKAVSDLLGHAGTQITSDVYAHLTNATARKAMDGLGSAIGL